MLVLELHFPAGRYHATPWGRHVNEGALDWPPAPWRILRALVATWHCKAKAEVPEPVLRSLIDTLAARPPVFELPPASPSHTRHYMPIVEGKSQKTTKVFDTFAHLDGPLRIAWDATLTDEQQRALDLLCARLGYFGRAESLVEAQVVTGAADFQPNARPLPADQPVPAGFELVRLLCPLSAPDYAAWKAAQADAPLPAAAKGKRKKLVQASSAAALPADLFEALHADTADLQAAGWTNPPGSRLVDYIRPVRCFDPAPGPPPRPSGPLPTVARFAVSSAVLPRIIRAVSVAERIHQALLARFPDGSPPAVLAGRDAAGQPLAGHQHLFILCEPNGPRDAITHVTLYARQGFNAEARRAIVSLQKVWGHGGHDIQLVLLGFGDETTFADCTLFAPATIWRSLTPFVPTRYPKTHRDGRPKLDADGWWIGSPEHDLRRLIAEAGLPLPTKIERLTTIPIGPRRLRAVQFQTQRYHGQGRRARTAAVAFQLTFAEAVAGPLAFGYAAHFGLGLFVPFPSRGSPAAVV
jgi:CRISPR-associated protein Csb2